jgi:uncharacterized protein
MAAATDVGYVRMRVTKAVGLAPRDGDALPSHFVVLDELDGQGQLVVQIGQAEAFALAASLGEMAWGRPMTYQFAAELVRTLGGSVREVRLDGLIDGAYAATVEVEGPRGVAQVDARCSDALNLAVLAGAPIFVVPEMLEDCDRRRTGVSSEAVLLQRAVTAFPMTINSVEP